MIEFLTTPDVAPRTEAEPARCSTATNSGSPVPVDLGFDHVKRPICMLETRGWECFKYCALVNIFLFVWGFTYGLLTSLNNATPNIANQTLPQVVSIISVFTGAYLFGPLLIGNGSCATSVLKRR